jgi:hypothetical protein
MWGSTSRMLKKRGWGSWDDPRARATRGLRRMRGNRQTVLLARRAPTIKRWSLNARSEEQSACSLWRSWEVRRPSPGQMARLGVPVGGRVRTSRAVGIIPPTPYKVIARCGLAPRNGASWRAGVGRVRTVDFLSILSVRVPTQIGRPSRFCYAKIVLLQPTR